MPNLISEPSYQMLYSCGRNGATNTMSRQMLGQLICSSTYMARATLVNALRRQPSEMAYAVKWVVGHTHISPYPVR